MAGATTTTQNQGGSPGAQAGQTTDSAQQGGRIRVSQKKDLQAAKVNRLYRQYQMALEELKCRQRLMEEAQIRLNQAMSKELSARDAYNQALAEYRGLTDEN